MKNELGEVLEPFFPALNQEKMQSFNNLIVRINNAYPNYRAQLVEQELEAFNVNPDDINDMKYKAALSALLDMTQQGWQIEVHDEKLYLKMTDQDSVDKGYIRFRLSSERKAQFQDKSVMKFIEKMEVHIRRNYVRRQIWN